MSFRRPFRARSINRAIMRVPAFQSRVSPTEIKSVDTAYTRPSFNPTPSFGVLNAIAQGTGFYERLGSQIKMWSLSCQLVLTSNSTNPTDVPKELRVAIVYDRQTNNALPNITDIFSSYPASGAPYIDVTKSGVNPTYRDRFLILYDERRTLPTTKDGAGTTGTYENYNNSLVFKKFIKLSGALATYSASPAAIASIRTGALYIVTISDSTAPTTWSMTGELRLRYTDG